MIYFTPLIGRWGNKLFQYCAARALAERDGATLATPPWEGEKIFQLPEVSRESKDAKHIPGYGQNQASLAYTRKQVREWFQFRPEIGERLIAHTIKLECAVGHERHGDYAGYGYPMVSRASYLRAMAKVAFRGPIAFFSEEQPIRDSFFDDIGASFLPDFCHLATAPFLFRANSSFSWWAATLGTGRVFSPVIDGLKGGEEHDCEFVEGNWPKLSEMADCTDLHLPE